MSSPRRFTGIGATVAALAIVLTGCFPAKPPPPPPKFKLAAGLWHTFGTAPGAAECHFARITASGATVDDVHSAAGSRYVQTAADDQEFVTSGCQTWVLADSPQDQHRIGVVDPNPNHVNGGPASIKQVAGNGDYRVSNFANGYIDVWGEYDSLLPGDAPFGDYQLPPPDSGCHWERLSNFSGDPGSIIAQGGSEGDGFAGPPGTFTVHRTDVGFRVFSCSRQWDGTQWIPGGYMYRYGTAGA